MMIVLQPETLQRLDAQLRESVDAFDRALYMVTDRLQISTRREDAQAQGSIVCLTGLCGKIELIAAELSRRGFRAHEGDKARYDELTITWGNFASEFSGEIERELEAQFEEFVLKPYATSWHTREILLDPGDFCCFQNERDSIECFLLGSRVESRDAFWDALADIEQKMREHIYRKVVPYLKEKWPSSIPNGNVDWVPATFWWRHL